MGQVDSVFMENIITLFDVGGLERGIKGSINVWSLFALMDGWLL
jgi:hypothetical protein